MPQSQAAALHRRLRRRLSDIAGLPSPSDEARVPLVLPGRRLRAGAGRHVWPQRGGCDTNSGQTLAPRCCSRRGASSTSLNRRANSPSPSSSSLPSRYSRRPTSLRPSSSSIRGQLRSWRHTNPSGLLRRNVGKDTDLARYSAETCEPSSTASTHAPSQPPPVNRSRGLHLSSRDDWLNSPKLTRRLPIRATSQPTVTPHRRMSSAIFHAEGVAWTRAVISDGFPQRSHVGGRLPGLLGS